ncbi:MAG: UDP-glucose 4-epimerase [Solirubrobacteraceae bacterium]|nr:UDP-glucose 4-epimerase [Solirubrobacteraceae bacterium]
MLTHARDTAAPARTVVVGSRGFVGSAVLAHLGALGWPAEGVSSADVDLTAEGAGAALASRLREDDAVVFVSALTPDRGKDAATLERNVRMARHVAEALIERPVAQLVNIGSDALYDDDANPVREGSCASPSSLHGAMHLAREVILVDACRIAGVPLVLLRPSLLFGPGDTHNGYGPNRYVRTALSGGTIKLFGEGEEQRDHVFIEDVARVVAEVLGRGSAGVLNVATGTSSSFRAAAEIAVELGGGDAAVEGSPRQNPITHRHFDTAATQAAFPGFAWTPLREGIERMAAHESS